MCLLSGLIRRPEQNSVPLQMAWKHPLVEKHPGQARMQLPQAMHKLSSDLTIVSNL
jgi:hypothetical protein